MRKRDILIAHLKAKQKIRKVLEQRQVTNASTIAPNTNQQPQTPPNLPGGLGGNHGPDRQP